MAGLRIQTAAKGVNGFVKAMQRIECELCLRSLKRKASPAEPAPLQDLIRSYNGLPVSAELLGGNDLHFYTVQVLRQSRNTPRAPGSIYDDGRATAFSQPDAHAKHVRQ